MHFTTNFLLTIHFAYDHFGCLVVSYAAFTYTCYMIDGKTFFPFI